MCTQITCVQTATLKVLHAKHEGTISPDAGRSGYPSLADFPVSDLQATWRQFSSCSGPMPAVHLMEEAVSASSAS